MGGSLLILGVAVTLSAAAITAAAETPEQRDPVLRAAAPARSAPATAQEFRDERTVTASLTVTADRPLPDPRSGIVTRADAGPGATIASGTTPLALDGAPVLALHTDVPLYRDLTASDRGEDVSALQRELARLGHDLTVTGRFDAATGRGLQTLEKKAGFPAPDRSLSRTDILWLPAPSVSVGAWSAVWGASAQAGETLGTLPGALTAVTLTPRPTALTPGSRTLTLWGQKGPLDDSLRSTDPDFLARLSATTDYRVMLAATEDNRQATGATALDEPLSTVKVPAAAVFGVDGSRGCIQSPSGVQAVEVVGAALGATLVTLPAEAPAPTTVRIGTGVAAKACR